MTLHVDSESGEHYPIMMRAPKENSVLARWYFLRVE
jgi:phage anti-repressor protein